jgi:putative flavoprotein involved in K+ transport
LAERIETVVIGAGQAGLAASYHLTQHGRDHVVLERGRVAETWRTQRWDGFSLNTPNWAQQLPGYHYRGAEPDAFAPLTEVIGYLEAYATSFRAPVREVVEVTRVRREDGGLLVEAGGEPILEAHNVVVAAGAYQRPTARPPADALPDDVFQLHTSEYRRPDQLPNGAVLVVGSGQSGCQIAEELLAAGRAVYLSVGRCPWLPRRYRGRDIVHWLLETGLAHDTVGNLPSPAARLTCNPPVSGNDGGHDCNPRWLAQRGVILLGRIEALEGHTVRLGAGLEENLAAGDAFVSGFKRRVDQLVLAQRLDVDEPEPEDEPHPASAPTEVDLLEAGIRTVLWANGFRPDHSWLDGVRADAQGWPVHERGVSTMPGVFFVGLHWLHTRKSALFLGVGEDAEHVVASLDSRSTWE